MRGRAACGVCRIDSGAALGSEACKPAHHCRRKGVIAAKDRAVLQCDGREVELFTILLS
jgi:hypothetical protein